MAVTRRAFLASAAATGSAFNAASGQSGKIPIGLQLFSVRSAFAADQIGTIRKVAAIGYQVVEFFTPYYAWTPDQVKDMRKLLDDLGIPCHSTHNSLASFQAANLQKTIDLNHAIGASYVVLSSSIRSTDPDDWRKLTLETIAPALETLRSAGLRGGYHNHQYEFMQDTDGRRPMDVIAANTPKDYMLQLDTGACVAAGQDPVAWINDNPGRINSLHLKDWNKEKGFRVLPGDGVVQWNAVLTAAAKTGGAEYFLIEQESSDYSEFDAAQRCFDAYRKMAI